MYRKWPTEYAKLSFFQGVLYSVWPFKSYFYFNQFITLLTQLHLNANKNKAGEFSLSLAINKYHYRLQENTCSKYMWLSKTIFNHHDGKDELMNKIHLILSPAIQIHEHVKLPSFHMLFWYSYNCSLWGVVRGLAVVPFPYGDLQSLLSHLFLLMPHFLSHAYTVYLKSSKLVLVLNSWPCFLVIKSL